MRLFQFLYAKFRMLISLRDFNPKKEFYNKRIAVVGAADSLLENKNGKLIDSYDIVVRINKAPHSWSIETSDYLGTKFTYLYHSFFENDFSGGGEINWELYQKLGIKKVINPNHTILGLKSHLNYYKRNSKFHKTYILSKDSSKSISKNLNGFIPTVGFSALLSVLQSGCKEIFITGFTFFKTPYIDGYRDSLQNIEVNNDHILTQGLHDPTKEFIAFKKALRLSPCENIKFDSKLQEILQNY